MVTEQSPRRCILVPIDLQGISPGALQTLVRIARLLDRTLLGLLLEDIRLQQVADLPFTTEITLRGGRERSLLRDHLSQRHSLVSSDTRRLLDDLARRDRVELRFENASGSRLHTALERDGQSDIFFPARQRWQLVAAARPRPDKAIRRLGLVLARTAQDQGVLDAAHMLQQAGLVSEIYVISVGPLDRSQLNSLYRPGSRICVQANLSCDPATISRLIRESPYDLLLLPGDCIRGVAPAVLETALDRSSGQVLVIN
ncbi:MAG: hypothetical protein OEW92_05365 [Gammaproteobacteria bacterium]|jgi:hypothetical protein|nr:hypothetical protein [Gammaproteobacteria bacterium]